MLNILIEHIITDTVNVKSLTKGEQTYVLIHVSPSLYYFVYIISVSMSIFIIRKALSYYVVALLQHEINHRNRGVLRKRGMLRDSLNIARNCVVRPRWQLDK